MSDPYTPKWFKPYEFLCYCGLGACGAPVKVVVGPEWAGIPVDTIERLDEARATAGVPFIINSARRCKAHNKAVGGSETSSHLLGYAFDIHTANNYTRFHILRGLLEAGFTRIGIYKTHIHVDDDPFKAAEVAWLHD